jgi:hypothetical protein
MFVRNARYRNLPFHLVEYVVRSGNQLDCFFTCVFRPVLSCLGNILYNPVLLKPVFFVKEIPEPIRFFSGRHTNLYCFPGRFINLQYFSVRFMDLYYFVWTQKAASVLALDDCVQEDLETCIDDCFPDTCNFCYHEKVSKKLNA